MRLLDGRGFVDAAVTVLSNPLPCRSLLQPRSLSAFSPAILLGTKSASPPAVLLGTKSASLGWAGRASTSGRGRTAGGGPTSTAGEGELVHTVRWVASKGGGGGEGGEGEEAIVFRARDGELLRTAALRRGLVSPHNGQARLINCRGLGTCGTCAVEIDALSSSSSDDDDGSDDAPVPLDPPVRNTVETARLALPPHGSPDQSPKLRLACQVAVRGDLEVTKRAGFWGQDGRELAVRSEAKTYLGELEFLFDRRSPTDAAPERGT